MPNITLKIDSASPRDLDTIARYYGIDWEPTRSEDVFKFFGSHRDLNTLSKDYRGAAR